MDTASEFDINNLPLVVGVDLGGIQIRAAVLRGDRLLSEVGLLITDSSPNYVFPLILDAISQAINDAHKTIDEIVGIGVGVPGLVNNQDGVVYFAPNWSGWKNVRLGEILKAEFQDRVPVVIDNDANAAALGEYLFGAGRGSSHMVYLTMSTGFGGSVIINGQVMRGVSGTAMEIGHMTINQSGERCNCGSIGCLETIASGLAIIQRATKAYRSEAGGGSQSFNLTGTAHDLSTSSTYHQTGSEHSGKDSINVQIVAETAEIGISEERRIIRSVSEALGVALVNIIHIFNPSLIILGGSLTQISPTMLIEPARRIVKERTMNVSYEAVNIVDAKLGAYVGLIGAGTLVYHNIGISIPLSQLESS